jgi:hypothetical protein
MRNLPENSFFDDNNLVYVGTSISALTERPKPNTKLGIGFVRLEGHPKIIS